MSHFGFFADNKDLPAAFDGEAAQAGLERWVQACRNTGDAKAESVALDIAGTSAKRRLLKAVFGNSPFLSACFEKEPLFSLKLLKDGPDNAVTAILDEILNSRLKPCGDAMLAKSLRVARRRVALAVALADISKAWSLEKVTGALSDFAQAAIRAAAAHQLRRTAARGAFELSHPEDPEQDCGLVVIAMGKLGAKELNYSSDVDLIVLYDAEKVRTDRPEELQGHFVRLTRNLVKMLEDRTADGYVFRMDLRLRPDPGSTPLAISVSAAETYYESIGQNWERAAMIKARAIAGDIESAERFLHWLRSFVWCKNLDFGSIRDIHAIKRQINAHRGGAAITAAGHNIKLGRGGIREIEFYAQTQQLIWGGREPGLRSPGTKAALQALVANGRVEPEVSTRFFKAYDFLRCLEHRLQMVNDEQTQTLPADDTGLQRLATFMGYGSLRAFKKDLLSHLERVEGHYADLFGDTVSASALETVGGNLVFTGSDPDPDTLKTLRCLGYVNPTAIDATVRGWHHSRYRATSGRRAREILTELMPVLLKSLAKTPDPDGAFIMFDGFLQRLPAGVQLFSMIQANPHLLELLAEVMGTAPRLARHLSRRASLLDGVMSGDFFDPPPPPATLDEELDRRLDHAETPEDMLDIARRWANDRKFQIGIQSLRSLLPPQGAALALSHVAETALSRLHPRIEEQFALHHGGFPKNGMAVIALGKLGGCEMTPASDLDLIFVYDPGDAEASDGEKPLSPSHYFSRLGQRLINALTAQTNEGRLYEVDMRLRPSGKAGPIAVSLESFERYQRKEAWTWEHMALTRARVISGPPVLSQSVRRVIQQTLASPRDPLELVRNVSEMKKRTDLEHSTKSMWEVKHLRGGLMDVEFIAQYLQLRYGHDYPEILRQNTAAALTALRDHGLLEPESAKTLLAALDLWQGIQGMLRLTILGYFVEDREAEAPEALKKAMARLGDCPDFPALKDRMCSMAEAVRNIFTDLISIPAQESADKL